MQTLAASVRKLLEDHDEVDSVHLSGSFDRNTWVYSSRSENVCSDLDFIWILNREHTRHGEDGAEWLGNCRQELKIALGENDRASICMQQCSLGLRIDKLPVSLFFSSLGLTQLTRS